MVKSQSKGSRSPLCRSCGVGETTVPLRWLSKSELLPCKPKDLCLKPGTHPKKPDVMHICNASTPTAWWDIDRRVNLKLADQLDWGSHCGRNKRPYLSEVEGRANSWKFSELHTCVHVLICASSSLATTVFHVRDFPQSGHLIFVEMYPAWPWPF